MLWAVARGIKREWFLWEVVRHSCTNWPCDRNTRRDMTVIVKDKECNIIDFAILYDSCIEFKQNGKIKKN